MNTYIDTHVHLDETITGSAIDAAEYLNSQLMECQIDKAVVLHLDFQRWSVEEVSEAITRFPRLIGFINIHPDEYQAIQKLDRAIKVLKFSGLKLHPRLQKFNIQSDNTLKLVQYAGELGVPIIICGFPDGDWLIQEGNVLSYAHLAKSCPDSKIIVAHMGGHHVIDLMMLAKRIPNLYMDTSYSLLYFRESSVTKDIVYAIKSMKCNRIFYGSDYPDRSIKITLNESLRIFREYGLTEEEIRKVTYLNANGVFK